MNNVNEVIALVKSNFTVNKTEITNQYQVAFEVNKNDVHQLLTVLKANGFKQLSYLSAVDWLAEGEFELVYIVFDWDRAVHVQIRTRLDRNNAVMNTIMPIYEGCKYYERETHEFFGIKFPGNPDYDKQLILEEWDDIPPLRKDFDPQAYSDKKFPVRKYSESHVVVNGESKQEKREIRKEYIGKVRKGGKK
jgi:NADH-quinone oxidoreductase subunit C